MTIFTRSRLLAAAAAFLTVTGVSMDSVRAAEEGACLVDDPTGTPLNVRSTPNGTILATLANGMRVDPVDETFLGEKRWLFVSRQGERLGWVFARFLVCSDKGDAVKGAPIPPSKQK
jgi:hypothetical protein